MQRVVFCLLLTSILLPAGCQSDDVGQACGVVEGRSGDLIPTCEINDNGAFIDDIARDPAFLCENFTCVSFQGSKAYCTKKCIDGESCPDGFACMPVLQSDPGPGSNIKPSDKFCVKERAATACE